MSSALASQTRYKPWTPALYDNAGVAVDLGSGATAVGEYRIVGDRCEGWFTIVLGTSPTFTNNGLFTVTTPVTARTTPTAVYPTAIASYPAGIGYVNDSGTEGGVGETSHAHVLWVVQLSSARLLGVLDWRASTVGDASYLDNNTNPYTLAAGDKIAGDFGFPTANIF